MGVEFSLRVAESALSEGHGLLGLGQLRLLEVETLSGLLQLGFQRGEGITGLGQPCHQHLDVLFEAGPLVLGLDPPVLLEAALLVGQLEALIQAEDGARPLGLGLLLLVHGQAEGLHFGGLLGDLRRELGHAALHLVQLIQDPLLGLLQLHRLPGEQHALGGLDLLVEFLRLAGAGRLAAE